MTLYVRIASTETDPAVIQGRVRELTRELAATLRPELPFIDAMSPRMGWEIEGVAGRSGVGATASFTQGQRRSSLTLRAVWLDEKAGEQEWSVDTEFIGPNITPSARRRGQLVILAGFHGAVLGSFATWAVLEPFVETTATILAVLFATPLGLLAGRLADRMAPPGEPPPDMVALGDAWRAECEAVIAQHPELRLVDSGSDQTSAAAG